MIREENECMEKRAKVGNICGRQGKQESLESGVVAWVPGRWGGNEMCSAKDRKRKKGQNRGGGNEGRRVRHSRVVKD
jgi:hypothetical protein